MRRAVTEKTITFVHCADLHLDSPFSGPGGLSPSMGAFLRKSTFRAFENAVDLALERGADFFIVSGDVYDGEDRSIRAQVFFLEQLGRLSGAGIPSFVACGNHDPLSGWEADRDFPPLVRRFGPEVESFPLEKDGVIVGQIHGYSYPVRDVTENIALRFAGRKGEGFNIAVLHCNVGGRKGHENYAPCSLDDLRAASMDYWALGHVHAAGVLCPRPFIAYPGCTQGRNIREQGKKGAYFVTLGAAEGGLPAGANAEFVPCDSVRWRAEELSVSFMERDEEFFQAVSAIREKARKDGGGLPVLLRLTLSGRGGVHGLVGRPGFLKGPGGLLDTLNEGEEDRPDFVFLEEIVDETAPALDLDGLASGSHLVGDFLKEVAAFREKGRLREGLEAIMKEMGVLDKIPAPEVLDLIASLTEEDVGRLLDRGVYAALSGLLEGGGR